MLAIEVRFLTGRYVATAHHDRNQPEWPPHPARLFSAMVAAWAEDSEDDAERAALEWLENQAPPSISASDAHARDVATHFVPVNDTSIIGLAITDRGYVKTVAALEQLDQAPTDRGREQAHRALAKARDISTQVEQVGATPAGRALELLDRRPRQARTYPSMTLVDPVVVFCWPTNDDVPTATLDELLARVTRLGHSSSLVSCRIVDEPPAASWVPTQEGANRLRVIEPGQTERLRTMHARHQGSEPRSLPHGVARYRSPTDPPSPAALPVAQGALSSSPQDWFVLRIATASGPGSGRRALPQTAAVRLAQLLRAALMSHADDPVPEVLSGHRPEGSPSQQPHVAFVPLPHVAARHADGDLRGAAIILPQTCEADDRRAVVRALGNWRASGMRLTMGGDGVLAVELVTEPDLLSMQPSTWIGREGRVWVSALPIALPRHPGDLSDRVRGNTTEARFAADRRRRQALAEAERQVRAACSHYGLPDPLTVEVSRSPMLAGSRPARSFPTFRQNDATRALVHARITFRDPIGGPVILGSGRYLGLGLMRPAGGGRP